LTRAEVSGCFRERVATGKTLADALYAVDWLFMKALSSTGQFARCEVRALEADRDNSIEGIEVNTTFFKSVRLPTSFKASTGNPSHSIFQASKGLKGIKSLGCLAESTMKEGSTTNLGDCDSISNHPSNLTIHTWVWS
jgi:hypothetical protein